MGYSSNIGSIQTLHGFVAGIQLPPTLYQDTALSHESAISGMATFLTKLEDACGRALLDVNSQQASEGHSLLRKAYLAQRSIQEQLAREKAQAQGAEYVPAPAPEHPTMVSMKQHLAVQFAQRQSDKFKDHYGNGNLGLEDYPFELFLVCKAFFDSLDFSPEYLEEASLTKQRISAVVRVAETLQRMTRRLLSDIDHHKELTKKAKNRTNTEA